MTFLCLHTVPQAPLYCIFAYTILISYGSKYLFSATFLVFRKTNAQLNVLLKMFTQDVSLYTAK